MTFEPRAPTHNLCVREKDADARWGQIGVAWENEDGSFVIRLNPCVTLSQRDDLLIKLYRKDHGQRGGSNSSGRGRFGPQNGEATDEPFPEKPF